MCGQRSGLYRAAGSRYQRKDGLLGKESAVELSRYNEKSTTTQNGADHMTYDQQICHGESVTLIHDRHTRCRRKDDRPGCLCTHLEDISIRYTSS